MRDDTHPSYRGRCTRAGASPPQRLCAGLASGASHTTHVDRGLGRPISPASTEVDSSEIKARPGLDLARVASRASTCETAVTCE